MSDEEGSVRVSGHVGLEESCFSPQGPWRGGGRTGHGKGSISGSRLVGLEYGDPPPRCSARGCFGEFEKALVLSGLLESS